MGERKEEKGKGDQIEMKKEEEGQENGERRKGVKGEGRRVEALHLNSYLLSSLPLRLCLCKLLL